VVRDLERVAVQVTVLRCVEQVQPAGQCEVLAQLHVEQARRHGVEAQHEQPVVLVAEQAEHGVLGQHVEQDAVLRQRLVSSRRRPKPR
jgi:hypothetical protein